MDNLLRVHDIMARYACCAATARTYMRQMIHQEKPLSVWESALEAWERSRTREPGAPEPTKRARRWPEPPKDKEGNYYIPRRRSAAG